ncbi:hypothetical protein [Deinococcus sp.]|uniref:hypothetical protein n=1 Tax=Deinococcus sp. TaxID=47478 RepID=UPI00391C31A5
MRLEHVIPESFIGIGVIEMAGRVFTFLDPKAIAPGRARMLMPDRTVTTVEHVPDWYWKRAERVVGFADLMLRGDVYLYTYFTCEEADDGTMFETAYATPEDYSRWTVIARAQTAHEAQEIQATIRAAWWEGPEQHRYPPADRGLRIPPPGFTVPAHPLDDTG